MAIATQACLRDNKKQTYRYLYYPFELSLPCETPHQTIVIIIAQRTLSVNVKKLQQGICGIFLRSFPITPQFRQSLDTTYWDEKAAFHSMESRFVMVCFANQSVTYGKRAIWRARFIATMSWR